MMKQKMSNKYVKKINAAFKSVFLIAYFGFCSFASGQSINWMNWTAPASYPSSVSGGGATINYASGATGSLTLPDSTVVQATLTGEVISQSCFTSPCGSGFTWEGGGRGTSTYTSANVPNLPPTNHLIAQSGYADPIHVLTFNQNVSNVLMNLFSLGNPTTPSAYQFTRDFVILSQDSRCVPATGSYCLVKSGLTLTGKEGSGTIQFLGTYNDITWTVTSSEFYSGFNIGVTSADPPAPPVQPIPTLGEWGMIFMASLMAMFGIRRMRRSK